MMIIDHIAFGILNANISKQINRKKIIAWSIFFSVLPDLPAFIFLPGTVDYLSHRAYTHSILLTPLYVFIPLILFHLIISRYEIKTFITTYLISLSSYLLHIFLDLITTYGINLWIPLSKRIDSLDILHEFDPFFMSISLLVLIVFIVKLIKKKYFSKKLLLFIVGFYSLYIFSNFIAVNIMTKKYESLIQKSYKNVKYQSTIPMTFWRWKGIAKNDTNYFVIRSINDNYIIKKYLITDRNKLPKKISNDVNVKKFYDYARFPVYQQNQDTISFFNLIYSEYSYRLVMKLDNNKNPKFINLTGFDLLDN